MFILTFFAILFLIFSIIFGVYDIKKRKKEGVKAFLITLYFGISMSLFCIFIAINEAVSILIFLHLILIFSIVSIKHKKYLLMMLCLAIISIIGIILCLYHILNLKYSELLYAILGIGIYLLPLLSYFDRKIYIVNKIQRCTEEVDAKIIKVYKGIEGRHTVYIPKFEFKLNGKIYKFVDSTEIYFSNKEQCQVGDIIKLFVSLNPNLDSPNCHEDVFLPNPYKENSFRSNIIILYIFTLFLFFLIIFLNFISYK